MRIFRGCAEGREIAMTRKGSNPHTAVLVAKNAPTPATPAATPPENLDMTPAEVAKTMKTMMSFDDVTKTYFVGLSEDAAVAFLAKSADDQKAEATAAKAAADKITAEAEAGKTGKTARELDLEKRLNDQQAVIDTLKSSQVERDLEKRAREDFAGFPGGHEAVLPLLKSFAKLPDTDRVAAEAVLKAQALLAKRAGAEIGFSEEEIAKAMPATAELEKRAKELAKAEGISVNRAKGRISNEDSALFGRVREEEAAAKASVN